MSTSPYLFPAADYPLKQHTPRMKLREAVTGFGIALRYQERAPDPVDAPEGKWCVTGHSIFILSGRILKVLRKSSLMVTAPLPSIFGERDSKRTQCS